MVFINKAYGFLIVSLFFNAHFINGNTSNFPYPQAWRIKNKTNESISFNVFYKSRYPGIFNTTQEIPYDSNPMTLEAGKEKVIELEPTTNLAYVVDPVRIEVSSVKGKTSWSPSTPGYYTVVISSKNNNLLIDATPWSAQDIKSRQQKFKDSFKKAIDYYHKEVKKKIDQFLAEKK